MIQPSRSRSRLARAALATVLACGLLTAVAPAASAGLPDGFTDELVRGGLNQPVVAAFAPDGRLFIGEKTGVVKTYDSLADGTATVAADLSAQVQNYWDRGLLGLAVHPQFPAAPYLYALYTYDALPGGTHPQWGDACPTPPGPTTDGCVVTARLSRLAIGSDGVALSEQVLITDWCQQYPSHTIGTVTFGPDGALYVGGGDGASFTFTDYGQRGNPCGDPPSPAGTSLTSPTARGGALRSQSPRRPAAEPRTLDGAILRVNPETGAGMPGNPLASSADANARRIVAYGMRNQFRFAFRPGTSELWVGDVGWGTWEEVNRIPDVTDSVAENFGWPCYEGAGRQPGYDGADLDACESLYAGGGHSGPYYAYHHDASVVPGDGCPTGSSAISGIAFENGSDYPADYHSALFFLDSSRRCIWAMRRGADGNPDPGKLATFATGLARPVQLLSGPGGDLYYVAYDSGELRRITYTSGNQPPTAGASASPASGPVPLTVRFDGSASADPDPGDVLSYAWDLDGDGAYDDATVVQPEYTYVDADLVTVGLRVTDQDGLSDTAAVTIDAGGRSDPYPVVAIDAPEPTQTWQVGQTVAFSGRAADPEDRTLPESAMSWRLTLQHCSSPDTCHAHVLRDFDGVASGSFVTPDHDYPSYLALTLTARDSDGYATSETVRLDPMTVRLDFASTPGGVALTAGASAAPAPFSRTSIVGSTTSLSAPKEHPGDYRFTGWSDGGARAHEITAPAAPTTYRATYVTCTIDDVPAPDCGGATPSAPRDFDAAGGRGSATVTWHPPYWPGEGGLTRYRVSVEGGDGYDVSPYVTSYRITGLGSTTTTFAVQAFSAAGPGPAVTVTLRGVKAQVRAPSTVRYGSPAEIAGTFTDSDTGAPVAGLEVDLWARPAAGGTWKRWAGATTNGTGVVRFTREPGQNMDYQLRFEGAGDYLGTASAVARVLVRQVVTAAFADSTVSRGTTAKLSGSVTPAHPSQEVRLQRYYSGEWHKVSSRTLSSTSKYTFSIRWDRAGTYRYRVFRPGDTDHASGYSAARSLSVS